MTKLAEKTLGDDLMRMTANVVAAYVKNNTLPAHQLNDVISTVFKSLKSLDTPVAETKIEATKPAISVKKSITPDYLICLEDGKKLKTLKRHLRSTYNMTPDEYRAKWGLPPDYPMVAPNYAAQRSAFAKQIGLGKGASRTAAPRNGRR
jgi:predicted transcriptional regulator